MQDLMREVTAKIASEWFMFGIHLGIPYATLRTIQKERRNDNMECFAEVFSIWKHSLSREPISWATVITVLESLHEMTLAHKLRAKYGAGTNTPGSSTSSSTGDDHDTGGANPSLHKPHTGE